MGIKIEYKKVTLQNAHPNTVIVRVKDQSEKETEIRACTVGGGNIHVEEINQHTFDFDGKSNYVLGTAKSESEEEFTKKIMAALGDKTGKLFTHYENEDLVFKLETKCDIDEELLKRVRDIPGIVETYDVKAVMPIKAREIKFYDTIQALVDSSKINKCSISETVINFESESSNRSVEAVVKEMEEIYDVMKDSIKQGLEKENRLLGNTFNGNAAKVNRFFTIGKSLCGQEVTKVVRNALAVMEVNGSMGKVATCPTAGSCGTIPAAVITIAEINGVPREKVVKSLFTAAGIGIIIAGKASVSGGVCGCQAEIGSASAMAAATLTELFDGDYSQIDSATSLALGNLLGLVCDPAAGMVEIPCIQRNTTAAMNAITCAEMALAGVDSVIPADEMIDAMKEVGELLPASLKATLEAGISNTPTARKLERQIFNKETN